ncbi:MAG: hypothetical protein PHW04_12325 [Candidatus Wallbacteria bacterium]|nr:hypothetical protein [Candidatus Wallbacteria bacterium]
MREKYSLIRSDISQPPRKVPFSVAITLLLDRGDCLLGSVIFFLGLCLFWIFARADDFTFFKFHKEKIRTAVGFLDSCRKSDTSEIGINGEPDDPKFTVRYTFKDENGVLHKEVPYRTNRERMIGETVEVSWFEEHPEASTLYNLQRANSLPASCLILIFPFFGLSIMFSALRCGNREWYLLKNGCQAEGTVVSSKPTPYCFNILDPVCRFVFEFKTPDEHTYQSCFNTHLSRRLTDSTTVLLLYDPADPENALPYDVNFSYLHFDKTGKIRPLKYFSGVVITQFLLYSIAFLTAAVCLWRLRGK